MRVERGNESVSQHRAPVKALTVKLDELKARGLLALVKKICSREGAAIEEVFSERRSAHIARARHLIWWELRDRGWNLVELGRFFERDHSSVAKGLMRAARELGLAAAARGEGRAA